MLVDNAVVNNVLEYTVVVEHLLAKDAATRVSATTPLTGDGECDCPYHKELHAHKKWPLCNYGLSTAIGGDCNDRKSLSDTLPLA